MSRELKRVPLNFKWPLRKVWGGFIHRRDPRFPKRAPRDCPSCGGCGLNKHSKRVSDDFYAHHLPHGSREWRAARWYDRITQDEVDALVREGRLRGLAGSRWDDDAREWTAPTRRPTAAEVNANALRLHDGINRWILIEARCRRLGIYGKCRRCNGSGSLWRRRGDRVRWERWRDTPIPRGPGYQMWETVSEGSPVTPVFSTPEGLADWLVVNEGWSRRAAAHFCGDGGGWMPSGLGTPQTGFLSGAELADFMAAPRETPPHAPSPAAASAPPDQT